MSADSHSTCPNCYSQATGIPISEITIEQLNKTKELDIADDALGEYFQIYTDKGSIVLDYFGAECDDCGYGIKAFKIQHPIIERT